MRKRARTALCFLTAGAIAPRGCSGFLHHTQLLPVDAPRRALKFAQYASEEGVVGVMTGLGVAEAATAASGGNFLLGGIAGLAAAGGAALDTGLVLAGINAACNGCVQTAPAVPAVTTVRPTIVAMPRPVVAMPAVVPDVRPVHAYAYHEHDDDGDDGGFSHHHYEEEAHVRPMEGGVHGRPRD